MVIILILNFIVIFVGVVAMSMVMHELGHILYFRLILKRKVRLYLNRHSKGGYYIGVGTINDYLLVPNFHKVGIYQSGIVLGYIPIFLYGLIYDYVIFFVAILYTWLCISDFKNLFRLARIS